MADEPATDDRSAVIHWAPSRMAARGNLFFIFVAGVRIAECWNQTTADTLVTALRQLPANQGRTS